MSLDLKIDDSSWEPIGPEDDPWSRILLEKGVRINGTGFHLEGWAVQKVNGIQEADYGDDELAHVHVGVSADGHWDTVSILVPPKGLPRTTALRDIREYVLVMSPYC